MELLKLRSNLAVLPICSYVYIQIIIQATFLSVHPSNHVRILCEFLYANPVPGAETNLKQLSVKGFWIVGLQLSPFAR